MLPSNFHVDNRQRLLEQSKAKLMVIAGHLEQQRSHDTAYPFRQDSNFLYLSGVNIPGAILVFDAVKSAIVLPKQTVTEMVFEGEYQTEKIVKASGVDEILIGSAGNQYLRQVLGQNNDVGVLQTYPSPLWANLWPNPARARLIRKLKRLSSNINLIDVRLELAKMRMVKQPVEIEQITKAVVLTHNTLGEIESHINEYEYEYEIEAAISASFRSGGATTHAYNPIVANGINATTLHYVRNDSHIDRRQLTLIDVGAEINGYAADITRVYSHSNPSSRQLEVIAAVEELQKFAISQLSIGANYMEYEKSVLNRVAEVLKNLNLISGLSQNDIQTYYPHRTSHFLGLDVHDVGDYSKPLAENIVMTVEPGIYIPEESIGVRIEDDVLITSTGAKILR